MTRRSRNAWIKSFTRGVIAATRLATTSGARLLAKQVRATATAATAAKGRPSTGASAMVAGMVLGGTGALRYRLYRPPGMAAGEQLPLMVMLHGCDQDAAGFAASTRMNRLAARERFLVLYPEQDRLANAQGCWNWFDTRNGRALAEAALVLKAVDQVCQQHPVDRARVGVAGLSAGASLAALLVIQHPDRFVALVMHSGIPPGTAQSAWSALRAMQGQRHTPPLVVSDPALHGNGPALLVIHGQADAVVSPRNGLAAVQGWAQAAGAQAGPSRRVQRGQRYPMAITDYKRLGRTVATLMAVDGLGHAWSGGDARLPYGDALGPDAAALAWRFVARQFRPPG